ncbi:MAG: hypothetical protein IPG93_04655 [Burkholderiales bacterium]|nr:hypothetical protein [Burkholderiales bacterium]
MAQFTPGVDITVKSEEPRLDVLATLKTPLGVGKHVFQLQVADDSGNASDIASVTVIVLDQERPTAVVDLIEPTGARVSTPAVNVAFGKAFTLTGDRSSDIGGKVVVWNWNLLQG